MLQFVVRNDGPEAPRAPFGGKIPFKIGRAPTADFQVSAPGVWDIHAEVVRDSSGKMTLRPVGEAIVIINGERSNGKVLCPGDEIQMGGISMLVGLSPVTQRALAIAEAKVWVIFGLVILVEIYCFLIAR